MQAPARTHLDTASTRELAERQEELVREFLPLARRLAARYRHTNEPLEDLTQVAYVGLVLAAKRYDPDRGGSFSKYAVPTILGELRRHIRDHGWAVRVPRGLQEDVLRVSSAADDARARLRRTPSAADVAAEAGLGCEQVLEAQRATSAYGADSLDRPIDPGDGSGEPMLAVIADREDAYERAENRIAIGPGIAELPPLERSIVAMRFFEDLTQTEIAKRLGVSQMQVSRLLRRALDRIYDRAGPESSTSYPWG
jgi:RNA polymerase sigma-B factor